MKVKDVMHKGVDWVAPDTPVSELAKLMREHDIGAIPIGENDRLIGMVTDRDITMRAVAEDRLPSSASVRDVMSEKIYYCLEDDAVEDAAKCMAENQVRRLPILNRDKRLTGIVSLADIAKTHEECEKTALEGVSEPSSEARREPALT